MNYAFELPSLEIEQMERAFTGYRIIEISDNYVNCQRCDNAVPIVGKLTGTKMTELLFYKKDKVDGKLLLY